MTEVTAVNGDVTEPDVKKARLSRHLPEPPAPRADGRTLTASTFVISAQKLEKLQKSVEAVDAADPKSQSLSKDSGPLSLGDVLQAFCWRAAVRARRRPEDSSSDDMSIIEMPTDVRTYFSSHLPPTYMTNCVIMNRQHMSVAELCSSQTSLYKIAQICREARTRVDQELVHDALSLLHTIKDNSPGNHTTAFLGQGIRDGPHSLLNKHDAFPGERSWALRWCCLRSTRASEGSDGLPEQSVQESVYFADEKGRRCRVVAGDLTRGTGCDEE